MIPPAKTGAGAWRSILNSLHLPFLLLRIQIEIRIWIVQVECRRQWADTHTHTQKIPFSQIKTNEMTQTKRNKGLYSFFFPIFGMILLVFFVRVSLFSSFFFSFLCDIYLSLSLSPLKSTTFCWLAPLWKYMAKFQLRLFDGILT